MHRTRLLATAAGMLLSCLAQADNCAEMPVNETIYEISNEATSRYMDVAYDSNESGGYIHQWSKNGRKNQQFKVRDIGGGYWTIHPVGSERESRNLALDVEGGSMSDGAKIIQWRYEGQSNQQWVFEQADSGAIKIISRRSGKLITVAQYTNGARLYQRERLTNNNQNLQNWYFNPIEGGCGASTGDQDAIGYAAGTTGGGNAAPFLADTCDKLENALEAEGPAVIQLPNKTLDCRTPAREVQACPNTCGNRGDDPNQTYYQMPGHNQSCKALFNTSYDIKTVAVDRYDRRIMVESNKTLEGTGPNSRLLGVTLDVNGKENVIIRNLAIEEVNPHITEAGDAISLRDTRNVWIDHISTKMISDGHVDIYDSKNLTLSWNRFNGENPHFCEGQDPFVHIVRDTEATFHHNYWYRTNGRNPSVSGSQSRAHIFNNIWEDVTAHGIAAYQLGEAKSEGNYFINTRSPHWEFNWNNTGFGKIDAGIESNIYVKVENGQLVPTQPEGAFDHTAPLSWSVPYTYDLQDASKAIEWRDSTGPR